ncbi:hypothetical protein E2C01_086666 [Portunus trituberculatus]|uniref:Uncharacterized protein n=1 Tax=Portunus trituberculatus TaxID=210409 RepID=A0A5B7JE33_PORTR|nr:hypothetical protein [Portunus trituberculatus]
MRYFSVDTWILGASTAVTPGNQAYQE